MSADNWGICPKCKSEHEAELIADKIAVGKAYGKLPAEEYLKRFNAIQTPEPLKDTLREDYCQHMDSDGKYSCEYCCSCAVCGFSFKFNHEEQVFTAKT